MTGVGNVLTYLGDLGLDGESGSTFESGRS
jgi:hypothetical protein